MGAVSSYVRSRLTTTMADAATVKLMIDSDKVVIFSKTYCPYCTKAKNVFDRLKQKFTLYELDERADGGEIQNTLGEITGARTVPRVFINGKCVGGGSDVEKMEKDGSLKAMLA